MRYQIAYGVALDADDSLYCSDLYPEPEEADIRRRENGGGGSYQGDALYWAEPLLVRGGISSGKSLDDRLVYTSGSLELLVERFLAQLGEPGCAGSCGEYSLKCACKVLSAILNSPTAANELGAGRCEMIRRKIKESGCSCT
ncbi:MAG: hypothetical protein PHI85_11385 [Victivallaceae bacterium]|nr:hypothetical protein [Victivallaceae bacterium]